MLEVIKETEKTSIKKILSDYDGQIKTAEDSIGNIDEEYRKKCEEAKKNLNSLLSELKTRRQTWQDMLASLEKDIEEVSNEMPSEEETLEIESEADLFGMKPEKEEEKEEMPAEDTEISDAAPEWIEETEENEPAAEEEGDGFPEVAPDWE